MDTEIRAVSEATDISSKTIGGAYLTEKPDLPSVEDEDFEERIKRLTQKYRDGLHGDTLHARRLSSSSSEDADAGEVGSPEFQPSRLAEKFGIVSTEKNELPPDAEDVDDATASSNGDGGDVTLVAGQRLYRQAVESREKLEEKILNEKLAEVESLREKAFKSIKKSRELAAHRTHENYGELLYQEHSRRTAETEKKRAQMERLEDSKENFAFKPEITSKGRRHEFKESFDDRMKKLRDDREKKIQTLQKQVQEQEDRELTFAPRINSEYPISDEKQRGSVMNHLDGDAARRQLRMTALLEEKEHRENLTFQPNISEYSQKMERTEPVHERLFSLSRDKSDRARAAQDETDGNNSTVVSMDASTGDKKAAYTPRKSEELYREAQERRQKRLELQERVTEEEHKVWAQKKLTDSSLRLAQDKLEKDLRMVFSEVDDIGEKMIDFTRFERALSRLGLFNDPNMDNRKIEHGFSSQFRGQKVELDKLKHRLWVAMDPNDTGYVDYGTFCRFLKSGLDRSVLGSGKGDAHPTDHTEAAIASLASEFKQINLNKLAYERMHKLKGRSAEVAAHADAECTFRPNISSLSKHLAKEKAERLCRENPALAKNKDRVQQEILYHQAKVAEEKRVAERLQRTEEQMKECTFNPKINKRPARKATDEPRQSVRAAKKAEHVPTQEREFLEHCTFKPNTSMTKKKPRSTPSGVPRGFEESVMRMKKAQEAKQEQARAYEELGSIDKIVEKNRKAVKPFRFRVDERKERSVPLLYMDVNLGPGRTGRIGIHKGDDPAQLAANFAKAYQLDGGLKERLTELVREHMKGMDSA